MNFSGLTASALGHALSHRDISSAELCRDSLRRIEQADGHVGAFARVFAERALADAGRSDERRAKGEPLHFLDGVPVALADGISAENSGIAARCGAAGLVIMGGTSLDCDGGVRNPYDTGRVAGPFSGGAAACLATGEVPLSVGTDADGALRVAAAYCGVLGLRPTDGAISMCGVAARSPETETPGPMARCAADLKLLLDILRGSGAGRKMDQAAVWREDEPDARGLLVGLPDASFLPEPETDEEMELRYAVRCLEEAGAKIVNVDLPPPRGVSGKTAPGSAREAGAVFSAVFRQCGVLLAPVSLKVAPVSARGVTPEPSRPRDGVMLSGVERAGLPALALPCGFAHGMPVGLQLIAPRWRENDLLSLAYAYECLVGPPAPARMRDVDSMNRF